MDDEIIILNVGGVKFETTRKTLIVHPETTLGKLFNPKNPEAIKPIYPGGNEYFIDRNGHAFYCILEYYRTGQVLWSDEFIKSKEFPVPKHALELECEYFKIPIYSEKGAARNLQQNVTIIDKFCEGLIRFVNEAMNRFITKVKVAYRVYGSAPSAQPFTNYEKGNWYVEFEKQGHGLLSNERVVSAIEKRLKNHFPSIKVKVERLSDTMTLIMEDYLDMDSFADNLD
ncbi:2066_t:CDS:2 [Dentiscutata heterogama]|uniref:2066_t:CDS:1 n=1 Tax=Dentiscutata heterogama TaxID=1316150 RepID=A0ACA9PRX6_9GLOM|nr:2066_t:CDS:2 [Dentiscutata heterogama]